MKEKTKRNIRGSITVLLVIILLPMMTFSAVIVDTSRINMARSMVSSAGDLAMNSALANYDTILKDVYGLFAMSQQQQYSDEELANSIRGYFMKTLVSYGVTNEAGAGEYVDMLLGDINEWMAGKPSGEMSNLLDMDLVLQDFSVQKPEKSSLANAGVLRAQIVEYMKYRAPLNFGLSFLDSLKAFKKVNEQAKVVQTQVEAEEYVQTVTQACRATIDDIREYDKLIDSIQQGERLVKGKLDPSDAQPVMLKDYAEQVDKYHSSWGDNSNYAHINLLTMVFLLKSPSTDSVYLSKLSPEDAPFIPLNNETELHYAGSGINVQISLASDTAGAKDQVEALAATMCDPSSAPLKTATTYGSGLLDENDLNYKFSLNDFGSFKNEDNAITHFVAYEKFLTDDPSASVKYSEAKYVLEQIYTFGKYYDNYIALMEPIVEQAKSEMEAAQNAQNNASGNADGYLSAIRNSVSSINATNQAYLEGEHDRTFLSGIQNAERESLSSVVNGIVNQEIWVPTATKTTGGKSFTDFAGFVGSKLKESSSDTDSKYLKVFKELIGSSLGNHAEYADVCQKAQDFLEQTRQSDFRAYMTKPDPSVANNELFLILELLYRNDQCVDLIVNNINAYEGVYNGYDSLAQEANEKTASYNSKRQELDSVTSTAKNVLGQYQNFTNMYQKDAYAYPKYRLIAITEVNKETKAIQTQFNAIKDNIEKISQGLGQVLEDLSLTKIYIEEYNKKLKKWAQSNSDYAGDDGDAFSSQNEADIKASQTQYNPDSLETLIIALNKVLDEYNGFYETLTDDVHFKYGSKKIGDIGNADDAIAAASGVKDSMPKVIDRESAEKKFDSMYNAQATHQFETLTGSEDHWKLLDPVLPVQFLRYLNETYPVAPPATEGADGTQEDPKASYETAKDSLTGENNGKDTDAVVGDQANGDFGYNYQTNNPTGTLPSQGAATKSVTDSSYALQENEDETINASDGIGTQVSNLDTILDGIGNIAGNVVEKTYILSYIFGNFSYNTIVQDAIVEEAGGGEENNSISLLAAAQGLMNAENIQKAKTNELKTLSNWSINEKNNRMFGAEIEYILYGSKTASTNVSYAKASIYGVRFVFNCIYAFTNSEIRNATMMAGMSVQAATLGFVPYKVVQIVLQLALAAGESALDLQAMMNGAKVAVVKTTETWALSLNGAMNTVQALANSAIDKVAKKVTGTVISGLQNLIDAGADKLEESVTALQENLSEATLGKAEECLNTAFGYVQSKIEEKLNEIQFLDFDKGKMSIDAAKAQIDLKLDNLATEISTELEEKFGGNTVGALVVPIVQDKVAGLVGSVQAELEAAINSTGLQTGGDIGQIIAEKMFSIKMKLLESVSDAINKTLRFAKDAVKDKIDEVQNALNDYVGEKVENLTEEAAEELKGQISKITNEYMKDVLDSGADAVGSGFSGAEGQSSSSVASMLRFGYKDYLMLFTFLGLCVNEDALLLRTADVIQMNLQHASKEGEFKHQKGEAFLMKDARTYVYIHAKVDLHMLFMNLGLFANMVSDEETEVKGEGTPFAEIEYNGVLGY